MANAEDWPVKLTVRNARALQANFFHFERDVVSGIEDAVTIGAGIAVRHIRATCKRDTGYMAKHATAKVSPNRRAFEAGWWREDFIGHWDWHTPSRRITQFYPVPIEKGWHDRAGNFHEGSHIMPKALARASAEITALMKAAVENAANKNAREI